jgi:hypothetical protein
MIGARKTKTIRIQTMMGSYPTILGWRGEFYVPTYTTSTRKKFSFSDNSDAQKCADAAGTLEPQMLTVPRWSGILFR